MAANKLVTTGIPGVYFREGAGRKRTRPDGSKEKCFCIRYRVDGLWRYETVGWESEGGTLEKAVLLRQKRIENPPPLPAGRRGQGLYVMQRHHAGRVGVYYRFAKKRVGPDGKPDKCYDILYSINGKVVYEKVGWASEGYTLADAVALRGARVKALRHPELCPEESERLSGATLNAVWEMYQERWLPNLKTKDIIGNYEHYIRPIFGGRVVAGIEPGEVEDFKLTLLHKTTSRTGGKLSPSSVKLILSDLRRIINKGIEWGLLKENRNAAAHIRVTDADRQRERFLTPEEVSKLLDCLQYVSCRLYFIVLIGLHTGMRLNEILNLRGQDIEQMAGIAHLNGKTGRSPAFFSEELKPVLMKLAPDSPSQLLFRSRRGTSLCSSKVSWKFKEVVDALGFNDGVTDSTKRVVFHTLRHTFCSWLAMKGVPLYTIGKLVGHKSQDMTQRYAKLSPDVQKDALKHIGEMLRQS